MLNKKLIFSLSLVCAFNLSSQALAVSKGDWLLRIGASNVSPNDKSGDLSKASDGKVGVDGDTQPSVNLTYMYSDNIGIEILAATPFKHDINGAGNLAGFGKVAETKQLPPTVSMQYHLNPSASTRPYAGIGLNYTTFFSEKTTGALAGTDIRLDDSYGLAAQVGVDVDISNDWFFNADVRYINIETTAHTELGNVDVEINPWVYTLAVGTKF